MPRTNSSRTALFYSPSCVSRVKDISRRGRLLPVLLFAFASWCLVAFSSGLALAQTGAENRTPAWLTPGSPSGSYSVSAQENISLFGGGLNFTIPLYTHGGRGAVAIPDLLTIARRQWLIKVEAELPDGTVYNPSEPLQTGGALSVVGRRGGYGQMISSELCSRPHGVYGSTLTRITFTGPDGTEVDLRDAATSGQPQAGIGCNEWGQSRGKLFVSADGSATTFYADAEVSDYRWVENVEYPIMPSDDKRLFYPSGYLMLRDGTRFRVENGGMVWAQDRNGNRTSLVGDGVTDPLNRHSGDVVFTSDGWQKSFPRFGGGQSTYRVYHDALHNRLRTTRPGDSAATKTYQDLFPGLNWANSGEWSISTHDPGVVASLELPNGRRYEFYYDAYGELARVVLPTGGAYEYDWNTEGPGESDLRVLRWVGERRVYAADGTLESRTTYERERVHQQGNLNVTVKTHDRHGSLVAKSKHFFNGDPLLDSPGETSYPKWRDGREYRTEAFDVVNGSAVLARVTETTWTQTPPAWWGTLNSNSAPPNNPRVSEVRTTLVDTSQVSRQTFSYDQFNNRTDVWEYDFGAGSAGALLRRTHTDYVSAPAYTDALTGAHVRNLPGAQWVSTDGLEEHKVSLTTFGYDEFALDNCPNIVGHAAEYSTAFTTRGNLTSVTLYADAAAGTGPVTATSTYDIAGNVVSTTDAKGIVTQVSYSDGYSDGVARNTYAYPTSVTTAAPNSASVPNPAGGPDFPAGAFGSTAGFTSHSIYNFSTGLVTKQTDANGKETAYDYSDPLNRLKAVTRPDGGSTTYEYGRHNNAGRVSDYVATTTALDAGRSVIAYQYFDGLGRADRSFLYEGGSPALFLTSDTQYDAMGRVWRVSNPHRTTGSDQPVNPSGLWTTTEYDALGRVKKVTTPDGAKVETAYSGLQMTVTDQAGRKRSIVSGALGRLTQVTEDPTAGGLNYLTTYTYDVLGNLRKVDQGGQLRYFMYDSLGRLTRAKNPEQAVNTSITGTDQITGNGQWSTAYVYDANGNLTSRTDARGVQTAYTYDRLNRNIITHYSGGGTTTPAVYRHYDNPAAGKNGRGRFWWTYTGTGAGVTAASVKGYDAAGRVLERRQSFVAGGAEYSVKLEYNPAGGVTKLTYPSGHTVTYNYDAAGRLGDSGAQFSQLAFTGTLGDGVLRTYAADVKYSEFGGVRQERFGTQTPLYNKRHYNVRGQLMDVRLGTQSWDADRWGWDRGLVSNNYSTAEMSATTNAQRMLSGADNNGNVRVSSAFIPLDPNAAYTDASGGSFAYFQDRYEYDALNRLTSVTEYSQTPALGYGQRFMQGYRYDRWGNRTVNAQETQVYGENPGYSIPEPPLELNPAGEYREVGEPSNRLYAAGDNARLPQHKLMRYDAAGNLVHDAHTGAGARTYDAENRMTAAFDSSGNWAYYTYDADGRRVRRKTASEEWWQVYGPGGELLAEYPAGGATFLPSKEYGYRGGELLVTMSSGDVDRLRRFVKNLYYNCLARDPNPTELAQRMDQLAQAGAQGGEAQLLSTARAIARSLFESAEYINRNRTTEQYVTDLYNAFLQRGPDTGGLNHWVWNTNQYGRGATLNAFEVSAEFATLSATVYGTASGGEDQRVDAFVRNFYFGVFQREPTATEAQAGRQRLNNAAAVSRDQVIAEARAFGVELIQSTNYNAGHTVEQYVTALYQAFLQRAPDGPGLNHWVNHTNQYGRATTLDAFRVANEYRELARTLYRETFWLVADHLGTPRMVADRTGSLAGVKRHDYLPFGEELYAGTGGRTPEQGYKGNVDGNRKRWAQLERDDETGLDYAQNRYYSSTIGRFTSPDQPLADQWEEDPQSWNLYTYAGNNPLMFIDPTGLAKFVTIGDTRYFVGEKENEYNNDLNAVWVLDDNRPGGGYWNFLSASKPIYVVYDPMLAIEWKLENFSTQQWSEHFERYDRERREQNQDWLRDNLGDNSGGILSTFTPFRLLRLPKLLGTARMNLLNTAKHPKLKRLIEKLYDDNGVIGNGSTADAIRYERQTGILLSRNGHIQAGQEGLRGLKKIVGDPTLTDAERRIVRQMIDDLTDALK